MAGRQDSSSFPTTSLQFTNSSASNRNNFHQSRTRGQGQSRGGSRTSPGRRDGSNDSSNFFPRFRQRMQQHQPHESTVVEPRSQFYNTNVQPFYPRNHGQAFEFQPGQDAHESYGTTANDETEQNPHTSTVRVAYSPSGTAYFYYPGQPIPPGYTDYNGPEAPPWSNLETMNESQYGDECEEQFNWECYRPPQCVDDGSGQVEVEAAYVFESESLKESLSQRETLLDQLQRNTYECIVCCRRVQRGDETWSCDTCFNIFHLVCMQKWADSSKGEQQPSNEPWSWRCPSCNASISEYPSDYYCFCKKSKSPCFNAQAPHSCGRVCGRRKGHQECTHTCGELCHPGGCGSCDSVVKRKCECGKTSAFVKCGSKSPVLCGGPCEKLLNCFKHSCSSKCHPGPCKECDESIKLGCFCGRNTKQAKCTEEWNNKKNYSCSEPCSKKLPCKNHTCPKPCHPSTCPPCPTSIEMIQSCPCGQTSVDEACRNQKIQTRKSCLDPIPTCGKPCKKYLVCGHQCEVECHLGDCPPCPLVKVLMCRCGSQEIEVRCCDFKPGEDVLCLRRCNRKRRCGKHKCNTKCCVDVEHYCPLVCGRQLSCGTHRCESLCHIGFCTPCSVVSFHELTCECGSTVIFPPVPCGTRPPPCSNICTRDHACDHPVSHTCHSEESCPPCMFLSEKLCRGGHELRKNVPCHIEQVSCGLPCRKPLKCGVHSCVKICHGEECEAEADTCTRPCTIPRPCNHPCGLACHSVNVQCPGKKCRALVEVVCECGRKKEGMICWRREEAFEKIVSAAASAQFNKNMFDEGEKSELSIEELTQVLRQKMNINTVLPCDKECAKIERNRKLAEALKIENPDYESIGPPNYSEFLKKFTLKNPRFVELVHEKLSELVIKVKKSKNVNTTFGFDSMNHEKRTLIHGYSDHFGIHSESFDEEPNRNVIVTASKGKCWLPSKSLIETVFNPGGAQSVKTERKNVFQDLELNTPARSQFFGPSTANGTLGSPKTYGMVALNKSSSNSNN